MSSVVRSKSWLAFMLAAVLFFVGTVPISAAVSGSNVEIRIKVGSNQMKINGEATKIQPPFQSAGNVMVPLSVFTNIKGLGAKLQLKDNKIITLTYQKHAIILTQGSKSATIDGKKTALPVAPVSKQGVQMVPLGIIVKTFGATLATDASTKEIVIKATVVSNTTGGANSGIDTDSGKSLIGDSYYKWSMNYPTGLVQEKQKSNGSWISFSDVKGDYYLAVSIEEAADLLAKEDKRKLLNDGIDDGETVVDMKTITRPAGSFERMVTRSKNGFYYEYRGIQANGYFYTLIFGKKAKTASELDSNSGLLDSFQPSYNSANKSLKDLARIKDGKVAYENSDYGLKIQLPKEWTEDTEGTNPYYSGPDSSYMSLMVNSIKQGDTLDEMVNRKLRLYKDISLEAYQKTPKTTSITWNGIPAILVEYSYSNDTKTWWSEYEVYAFKGNYKYYVNYTFKAENKDKVGDILDIVLNGMKIDFAKVEKSFGEIPDPADTIDLLTKVTKTSKTQGYSITLPKYWTKGNDDMESGNLHFMGYGIDFIVSVDTGASLAAYPEMLEKNYTTGGALKIQSKTNVTYAGVNAIKYELVSTEIAKVFIHSTSYLFEKNGNVYLVQGLLNDTSATELNQKQLEEALNSFQFNK
jgi:hypothetical protein